ncbi:glycosyltransferase family 2 protein [Limosilactobacillus reuteri]|uniref:Glycosyltransferase family 2 protein n=1 Tax=Limosilactobacillus reuteri TaxID=1598 RepID=A0A517D4U6_LIMRT|nr:glycosyltransferase family 2 protein [Limosilactobacillus reuteri]QDR72384.1 glycosyltransferase family 2 protein [Limosilactobacillus reuteri]
MISVPFFSVIVNTHNNEDTIRRTLNSVIYQTFSNFELVIVDDASSDATVNIVKKILNKYKGKGNVIELKNNTGISNARNIGVTYSRGKYIAFLDGDDLWEKNKLEIQHSFLSNNLINWIFSNYSVINEEYIKLGNRCRKEGVYDYKSIINNGNPVGMLTVVLKRELLIATPFRNVRHEDYDLWIRLAKKGVIGYLQPNILGEYMKHKKSISSNKFNSILWTYGVFRSNKINVFKSIWLVFKYINNYFNRKNNEVEK